MMLEQNPESFTSASSTNKPSRWLFFWNWCTALLRSLQPLEEFRAWRFEKDKVNDVGRNLSRAQSEDFIGEGYAWTSEFVRIIFAAGVTSAKFFLDSIIFPLSSTWTTLERNDVDYATCKGTV